MFTRKDTSPQLPARLRALNPNPARAHTKPVTCGMNNAQLKIMAIACNEAAALLRERAGSIELQGDFTQQEETAIIDTIRNILAGKLAAKARDCYRLLRGQPCVNLAYLLDDIV